MELVGPEDKFTVMWDLIAYGGKALVRFGGLYIDEKMLSRVIVSQLCAIAVPRVLCSIYASFLKRLGQNRCPCFLVVIIVYFLVIAWVNGVLPEMA